MISMVLMTVKVELCMSILGCMQRRNILVYLLNTFKYTQSFFKILFVILEIELRAWSMLSTHVTIQHLFLREN
jgi:hypothetical protein